MASARHGILFKLLLAVVIVAVVVGVAFVVVCNLTLRQMGFANTKLTESYTVDGLGIADIKVGKMVKLANSLTKQPDENKLVKNPYITQDASTADAIFAKTAVGTDYKKLFLTYSLISEPTTLSEKQLAYVLNSALKQFYVSDAGQLASEYIAAVEVLRKLDASVCELSFFTENGKYYLKTVTKLDVSKYVAELNATVPKVSIANFVYCTFVNEVDVRSGTLLDILQLNGVLKVNAFVSVAINDQPADVSEAALNALLKLTADDDSPTTAKVIGLGVGTLVSDVFRNIGDIGIKNLLLNVYGIEGVDFSQHTVTFLPRKL